MASSVVITVGVDETQRTFIREVLAKADLTFLAGLTENERFSALNEAQVVFSWNLPRELSRDEFRPLENARLIQLVSAGVDHLPFAALPNGPIIASNAGGFAEPMAEHVLGMSLALAKRLCSEHPSLK
jgi:phosphoglycerate dehydrogenase-like enzyme